MLFTTKWLSSIFTDNQGSVQELTSIDRVSTDTRVEMKDALFIPIVGENFDGHDFVTQAIDQGAVAVLWDKRKNLPNVIPTDFPVFFVDDTTSGLQHLANKYRHEVNPIVIGITGSNGKTSTKDMVTTVMKATYRTHYTDGNFNNHLGLPFTILSMKRDTEVLVLEMGMSNFGEIELLSNIANPDYAIITNIGESHIEYLGSRQGIAKAKLEITSGLKDGGILIIDGDEKLLNHMHSNDHVITCGFNAKNDVTIDQVDMKNELTVFQLSDQETYTIPLLGEHQAKNASFAITLGKQMNIDITGIKESLHSLSITSMRFEKLKGVNDVFIINDAYNASPTSMRAAIDVVKQMKGFREKVLILGDILELGDYSEQMHLSVVEAIDPSITALFTVGKDSEVISTEAKERYPSMVSKHFTTLDDLQPELQKYLKKENLLLFKASRGMHLESIIEKIQNI